jgi:hypothetical protein
MVVDRVTFFMYTPFDAAGLAFLRSASTASRLPRIASSSKSILPIPPWMMPFLSVRKRIWPALAFLTAVSTSGVTVPVFGFGMRPRGPSN